MSSAKDTVQRYLGLGDGRGRAPISDFLAENIRWHLPAANPHGGTHDGLPAVKAMLAKGGDLLAFDSLKWDHHALVAEGDNVVAHFTLSGKTPDGRDYQNDYLARFRCENDKIVEVWEIFDTHLQYQMGMYD